MKRVGHKVLVKGIHIFYEKVGCGNHVLLLMPGSLGTTKTDFDIQLNTLNPKKFTIIAWDPPGFGQSRPPRRLYTLDHWHQDAEMAASLMEVLGYSKYSLLGWSNGGVSAAILAARYSSKVEKLVIWGVSSYITIEEVEITKQTSELSQLNFRAVAPYVEVYGEKLFTELWKESCDIYIELAESGRMDIFTTEIENIRADTLIIHGEKDRFVPKFHAEYLHRYIKGSRLVCWEDGKHNLHIRFPQRFNTLVEDFLNQKSVL